MLNLDQIKQLEARVSKAIELMQTLKDENDLLKLELHDRQKRIEELENIVLVFRNDQAKIEEGIINALNHLSAFEDTVYQAANSTVSVSTSTAGENSETQTVTSDTAASGQPEIVQEKTEDIQSATTVPETISQSVVQEPANQSNQLDIF